MQCELLARCAYDELLLLWTLHDSGCESVNERLVKKFIFAFLSLDALNIMDRPGFMTELRDYLARQRGLASYGELTDAEQFRLNKAAEKAHDRLEQLAGADGLDAFWGRD